MITNFKLYEKSILTKYGFPHNIMVNLQKHFQIKDKEPLKIKNTKKEITKYLKDYYLILILHKSEENECYAIYRDGWTKSGNPAYKLLKVSNYVSNHGKLPMSKIMKDIFLKNTNIYAFKNGWSSYRSKLSLSEDDIKKNKIIEFKEYFNNNSNKLLSKYYSKKWVELVNSVRTYYNKITNDPKTFLNRLEFDTKYPQEKEKIKDFSDMGYTLKQFAEKLESNTIYKISNPDHYDYRYNYISRYDYKKIVNFLLTLNDFEFDKKEKYNHLDYLDILIKAIDQYGIPKLARLFARYNMNEMSDWLREKINKYSGLKDEIENFNL